MSNKVEAQIGAHTISIETGKLAKQADGAVTVRYETEDCRLALSGCPSGQICDPVYGGCFVPPTECARDAQCGFDEYCDDTGACRLGCRLETRLATIDVIESPCRLPR
jgi:hypothetical protein